MGPRLRSIAKRVPGAERWHLQRQASRKSPDAEALHQQLQLLLMQQHQSNAQDGQRAPRRLSEVGFRCYSQFEEDGIILYLLALTGMATRRVVEIGCGAGAENMSTNLILNHGYEGFLFDGSQEKINRARSFFSTKKDCLLAPPSATSAWITRENVNEVLESAGASGEVDLFSLDIDGVDWHIWNAIEVLRPRVCVFETQDIIPSDRSLTVPYRADFDFSSQAPIARDFRSVSLLAMTKLSESKGYRLVGGHRHGFNAFYVRSDLVTELLPEADIATIHDNPWTRRGQRDRWPRVSHMDWQEV